MIDTTTLKAQVDILTVVSRDTELRRVAGTEGGEWAGPCPFRCGRDHDGFRVQPYAPGGGRWLCRGCTDGKWQDAIAYVMRRENCDFRRACDLLGAAPDGPARPIQPARPEPKPAGPPPTEWQAKARAVIETCERFLWDGKRGQRALDWLRARGLTDETLRRWHIGYHPGEGYGSEIAELIVPFGIVIPCQIGGVVWYVKVRRTNGEPKYIAVRDGRTALFGAETLTGHDVAVICEGEFDAMLLEQECGDLTGVVTLGSETPRLNISQWGRYLLPLTRLWVLYDVDGKSEKGANELMQLTARAKRITVPKIHHTDKDVTDYWKAGGDLRGWLPLEFAFTTWRSDPDPAHTNAHRLAYAQAAIRARMPIYDDDGQELDPLAWLDWAGAGRPNEHAEQAEL